MMRKCPARLPLVAAIGVFLVATVGGRPAQAQTYTTSGSHIVANGSVWMGSGVNAFDQYGLSSTSGHGIKVVREVVDDMSGCPIGSGTVSWNGSYLHGLQDIVDNNRAQGEITILAMFGWDSNTTQIAGSSPEQFSWFNDGTYASRLAAIAAQFKDQSDVWIDPWNEPYNTEPSNATYLADMNTMVSAIRNAGNNNIIVLPSPAWDSDMSYYENNASFLSGKSNITATLHIYSGWDWQSESAIQSGLQSVLDSGWPLLVGEIGPDSYQPDPVRGIQATIAAHVPTLAWAWNSYDGDQLQNGGTLTSWGNEWFGYGGQYTSGVPGGTYRLSPACAPGSCLEDYNWQAYNGALIDLWWWADGTNQKWIVSQNGNGTYTFLSVNNSGYALDCTAWGTSNGTAVEMWTSNGYANQQWNITETANGVYKVTPSYVSGMALDVSGAGNANGTKIQIWQDNGTSAQQWSFIPE